jgi:hypothetical protein
MPLVFLIANEEKSSKYSGNGTFLLENNIV